MTTTNRKYPHRIYRQATLEEREKYRKMRDEAEADKPYILAQARAWKAASEAAIGQLREAFRLLRAERERQGLSLADLQKRTGMSRSALCRLETDLESNPTLTTLERYADALGKRLLIVLADPPAGRSKRTSTAVGEAAKPPAAGKSKAALPAKPPRRKSPPPVAGGKRRKR